MHGRSFLIALLLLAIMVPTVVAGDVITPDHITGTLAAGECLSESISLKRGPGPVPQLDLLFVFDVTGSMSDEIDQMKARATEIVQRVQAIVPDTVFAVATLSDYPLVTGGGSLFDILGKLISFGSGDDYPWRLDLDFTPQAARVQAAINNIRLMDGGDNPESYLRALKEVQSLAWRPRTRRIVVLFGDSYAHDPDPGPDAQMGTSDDVTLTSAVQGLRDAGISILSIYSGEASAPFFSQVSKETEGQAFGLPSAAAAPKAVVDMVKRDVSILRQVTLQPDAPYKGWVTWQPSIYPVVEEGKTVTWQTKICRPADQPEGTQRFELGITTSGSRIYGIPVIIAAPPTPTPTLTSTPTVTPSPTATATPSATPSPTPTLTPAPFLLRHVDSTPIPWWIFLVALAGLPGGVFAGLLLRKPKRRSIMEKPVVTGGQGRGRGSSGGWTSSETSQPKRGSDVTYGDKGSKSKPK